MLLVLTLATVWLAVVLVLIALVWPLQNPQLVPERVVSSRRAPGARAAVRWDDPT